MRELGLLQPFRGGPHLDGGEAVIEVELLGEHGPQGLVVVDQEDLLATVVYRHACHYLRPTPSLLYLVRSRGKSGSLRQNGLRRAKDQPWHSVRSFRAPPLHWLPSSGRWRNCGAAASWCCATPRARAAW